MSLRSLHLPRRTRRWLPLLEQLECRWNPSGNPFIVTPHDKIPNFGQFPTVTSVMSGAWTNPATWSTGQVPGANAIVSVEAGHIITYDSFSTVIIKTVAIQTGGSLRFRTDIDTRLTVVNFLEDSGGELQIGTVTNPVAPNVKADVIFADVPLDLANDPEQYGNGLTALGKVTVFGTETSDTFVRLAVEPQAGATTLTLSQAVVGWNIGNRLVLPDTRQLADGQRWGQYTSQLETVTIAGISPDGLTLTLSQPLQYAHLGARTADGVLQYLPHVGMISHNVAFRSQSSQGTRGFVMFTQRAEVNIQNAAFQGLGRTTNAADDDTILDSAGQVAHLGTNQTGRYAVTFNHLLGRNFVGPVPQTGYTGPGDQFIFVGNSVSCMMSPQPYRWGLAITESSFGLIQDNVVYNWAGAGIAATTGTETDNVISHNFVVGTKGDDNPRYNTGRDGSAFWLIGGNNYVRDNIAADAVGTYQGIVAGSGFNIFVPASSTQATRIPLYPGADTTAASQYRLINLKQTPILEFARNEAYGALATGLTLWHFGTDGYVDVPIAQSVIKDFVAWHVWEDGFFGYPIHNVLFDGFRVIGDAASAKDGGGVGWTSGDYWASDVTIRNADIQNMSKGIGWSTNTPGTFRIESSFLRNYYSNVLIQTLATPGSRATKQPRTTIIDNVSFQPYEGAPNFYPIFMNYSTAYDGSDFIQRDEVYVYNYNGVAGDNFQLYYLEQNPTFVVPQTNYYGPDNNGDGIGDWINNRGELTPNLTNSQAFAANGTAIAGAVAPTSLTRPFIRGLVRQLTLPQITSTLVNGGAAQRSMVEGVFVQFNQPVVFPNGMSAAFRVMTSSGVTIPVTLDFDPATSSQSTVRIRFPNETGGFSTIADGAYSLEVLAAQVNDLAGHQLDGNGDGATGDNYSTTFHRLYGDTNGDRTVDTTDWAVFRGAFNLSLGNPVALPELDFEGNGIIDLHDFTKFRARFGLVI